ncbi:MAG: hypothetical protein ABIB71_05210 [Candidatus Woesearchaeota archaeon]
MGKVICKCGIKRQKGFLYFLDKKGNVAEVPMARGGGAKKKKPKQNVVYKAGIKRESGYLYYIDKAGDVCMAKMAKPGAKKKAAKKKK